MLDVSGKTEINEFFYEVKSRQIYQKALYAGQNKSTRRVRRMEKVDELIEALAEHISYVIASGKECENEISEKTKALAELISARAKFPVTDVEIKTDLKPTWELADTVLWCLLNTPECQTSIKLSSSSEIFRGKQIPQWYSLEALCQPVVDWLKKNHDPHTEVRISADHIDLVESVIGIPVGKG